MMREAIASFKTEARRGYTLVELLAVIVIMTGLLAISVPVMNGVLEKAERERNVAEAEMVFAALNQYLVELSLEGEIDSWDISVNLSTIPLTSKFHPLYNRVEGISKGARLISVKYGSKGMSVHEMHYDVNGYRIIICPAEDKVDIKKL